MKGRLICFEGIDGSGKGSQIEKLRKKLHSPVIISYPDKNSVIGKLISEFLRKKLRLSPPNQFFLYASDIFKDQETIKGELEKGKTVILDRYALSTLAYQDASGFPMDKGLAIVKELDFLEPDLTILLDIDPEISVERKKKQNSSRLERFEKARFLRKVRKNYLLLAKKKALSKKWLVIDGSKGKDEIARRIASSI